MLHVGHCVQIRKPRFWRNVCTWSSYATRSKSRRSVEGAWDSWVIFCGQSPRKLCIGLLGAQAVDVDPFGARKLSREPGVLGFLRSLDEWGLGARTHRGGRCTGARRLLLSDVGWPQDRGHCL